MAKTTKDRGPPKGITKLMGEFHRHHKWQVFGDFVEMAAISLSNAVDLGQREMREARYTEIVKLYSPDEVRTFPQMMASLVMELEAELTDVLGKVFHDLELHNKWTGQFFTPFPVCQMMAQMTAGDSLPHEIIKEKGFLRAMEPACGSGAMVIALANALRDERINYQQHLHVTAIDIDAKCVHMAYLQFSLLHIPAVVIHGNALAVEDWAHWKTPAHIMGGCDWKLRRGEADTKTIENGLRFRRRHR
jgi:hypothetical protein